MNTEKLQLLATSCIPRTEKEAILCIWNSPKSTRIAKRFPVPPFSDTNFATYLHRYVFWYQLKTATLNQLPSLLDEVRCSDKQPSRSFAQYIDFSRSRHWEYAISEQIKSKEINKSVDWEGPKNTYEDGAMRRLIYRYWMHVLMKERVALEESPNFVEWLDPESDEFIYTSKQEATETSEELQHQGGSSPRGEGLLILISQTVRSQPQLWRTLLSQKRNHRSRIRKVK